VETSLHFVDSHEDELDHLKPRFEILHLKRHYFVHSLEWSFWTLKAFKTLQKCAPVNTLAGHKFTFCRLQGDGRGQLKPRFEILHQWRCYFVHSLEWSFWTLKAYKNIKTRAPANTLVGHKLTICRPRRGWTRPSETSMRNTSPMKMLFCTLIGVILLNSKSLQKHKNSCPRKYPSWTQVNNLPTTKGDGLDHLKPRFEILHQWRCYFVHSLEISFWTLNACKTIKNRAPVNTLAGHKFTFCGFPRERWKQRIE